MRPVLAALAVVMSAAAHAEAPPACPTAFGVVERNVGPPLIYLPGEAARPETCRLVQRGGEVADFYYGIWKTDWPGADQALLAFRKLYRDGPGSVVRFNVAPAPGYTWHATLRNEGFENLNVLGVIHRTMKLSHEREGYDGNTYHSIITVWKDVNTGMTIYQNYNHIAGMPEAGPAWNPLTIYGGR